LFKNIYKEEIYMQITFHFDEKNKLEYPITVTGKEIIPYPLGYCLIDFIELDFLNRDISNISKIENPILDFCITNNVIPTRDINILSVNAEYVNALTSLIKDAIFQVLLEDESRNGLNTAQRFFIYSRHNENFKSINSPLKLRVESLPNNDLLNKNFSDEREYLEYLKNSPFNFYEVYDVENIQEALFTIFMKMVVNDVRVKTCSCCQKLFIPTDKAEIYCNRPYKDNKTCKDVGYLLKIENNELLKAYNTAYKTKHAQKQRLTRNKSTSTINKYADALSKWRDLAKQKLEEYQKIYNLEDDVAKKQLIINEFKEFLNKRIEIES
jgi:hypothetical protein